MLQNRVIIENLEDGGNPYTKFWENGNYLVPRWNPEGFRDCIIGASGSGKTNYLCNLFLDYWVYDRAVLKTTKPSQEDKFRKLVDKVGEDRLMIIPTEEDGVDGFKEATLIGNEFLKGCLQGIDWDDDPRMAELSDPIMTDKWRKGRKGNLSSGFSTQSYDTAKGDWKKHIMKI